MDSHCARNSFRCKNTCAIIWFTSMASTKNRNCRRSRRDKLKTSSITSRLCHDLNTICAIEHIHRKANWTRTWEAIWTCWNAEFAPRYSKVLRVAVVTCNCTKLIQICSIIVWFAIKHFRFDIIWWVTCGRAIKIQNQRTKMWLDPQLKLQPSWRVIFVRRNSINRDYSISTWNAITKSPIVICAITVARSLKTVIFSVGICLQCIKSVKSIPSAISARKSFRRSVKRSTWNSIQGKRIINVKFVAASTLRKGSWIRIKRDNTVDRSIRAMCVRNDMINRKNFFIIDDRILNRWISIAVFVISGFLTPDRWQNTKSKNMEITMMQFIAIVIAIQMPESNEKHSFEVPVLMYFIFFLLDVCFMCRFSA